MECAFGDQVGHSFHLTTPNFRVDRTHGPESRMSLLSLAPQVDLLLYSFLFVYHIFDMRERERESWCCGCIHHHDPVLLQDGRLQMLGLGWLRWVEVICTAATRYRFPCTLRFMQGPIDPELVHEQLRRGTLAIVAFLLGHATVALCFSGV